jgi:hypothetical protein
MKWPNRQRAQRAQGQQEPKLLLSIFRVGGTFRMACMTLVGGQETSG